MRCSARSIACSRADARRHLPELLSEAHPLFPADVECLVEVLKRAIDILFFERQHAARQLALSRRWKFVSCGTLRLRDRDRWG